MWMVLRGLKAGGGKSGALHFWRLLVAAGLCQELPRLIDEKVV